MPRAGDASSRGSGHAVIDLCFLGSFCPLVEMPQASIQSDGRTWLLVVVLMSQLLED